MITTANLAQPTNHERRCAALWQQLNRISNMSRHVDLDALRLGLEKIESCDLRNERGAWAKKQGVSYKTAWRWWKAGTLPVPAEQMASGTVIVHEAYEKPLGGVALYARVSSSDQKVDLQAQLGRLSAHASNMKLGIVRVVSEVGSGLNGHRPKLMKLLADPAVSAIMVEHRDRLMRFGSEYVESALAATGRKLIVVNPDEVKDDLVQDMIEVLTSFCARLYGRRSARDKAKKAIEAMETAGG